MAAYFTPDFLAISFQKRLVEQVIDARLSKKSLIDMPSFKLMHAGKNTNVEATVYVRIKSVDMGKIRMAFVRKPIWEVGRSLI